MITHIIINTLIGLMFVIFGFAMIKYKAVYLIAGYEPGKYDDDMLSKICGSHLLLSGFIIIVLNTLFFFNPYNTMANYLIIYSILMIDIAIMAYECEKYAKK